MDIRGILKEVEQVRRVKRQAFMERQAGKFSSRSELYCLALIKDKLKKYSELNIQGSDTSVMPGWELDITIKSPYGWNVAVEWDGAYHRRPIYGETNLRVRQGRDKYKNQELYKQKYVLIRVKDDGRFNPSFVQEKADKITNIIEDLMAAGVCAYGKIDL